jgi:hypothetical protein
MIFIQVLLIGLGVLSVVAGIGWIVFTRQVYSDTTYRKFSATLSKQPVAPDLEQ